MTAISASEISGKILVVDDSIEIREVIVGLIKRATGFEIFEAGDGQEALEILATMEMDVIILDEKMPRMGGHECFEKIRGRSIHTPVIFCTGAPDPSLMKRELYMGAFDYLSKPFAPDDLLTLVKDAYQTMQRLRDKST